MDQYITLGTVPYAEDCVQVTDRKDYAKAMLREAKMFKEYLLRVLEQKDIKIPENAGFTVKKFPHDFGSYYDLVVTYKYDDEEAGNFAYDMEDIVPEYWNMNYADKTYPAYFYNYHTDHTEVIRHLFPKEGEQCIWVSIYKENYRLDVLVDENFNDVEATDWSEDLDGDKFLEKLATAGYKFYAWKRDGDGQDVRIAGLK